MRIVMTGATAGFGLYAAERLLDAGHELLVGARTPHALPGPLVGRADARPLDLDHFASVREFAAGLEGQGPIDALVLNAGLQFSRPETGAGGFERTFAAQSCCNWPPRSSRATTRPAGPCGTTAPGCSGSPEPAACSATARPRFGGVPGHPCGGGRLRRLGALISANLAEKARVSRPKPPMSSAEGAENVHPRASRMAEILVGRPPAGRTPRGRSSSSGPPSGAHGSVGLRPAGGGCSSDPDRGRRQDERDRRRELLSGAGRGRWGRRHPVARGCRRRAPCPGLAAPASSCSVTACHAGSRSARPTTCRRGSARCELPPPTLQRPKPGGYRQAALASCPSAA